ncbi:MAG: hypothetical protein IJX75_05765 [Clostridia bacterium]|nr:hypothetical protein [Clostridia bacterium]
MITKTYFNVSQAVISQDNVQRIAELISLKALKMLCQFLQKAFVKLYKGLIQDVYYPTTTFSDGYDIVQTVICFLCEYMGKRMDTVISIDKKGKPVDIKQACFKIVNHQVHKYTYIFNKFRSMDLPTEKEYVAPDKLQEEQDYSVVDETLAKMNLNQGQQDVLDCFMNGMSYRKAASYLGIAVSTVFRRRIKIQMIYNAL